MTTVKTTERFVRLKDDSIVVCLDVSKPGAKYRYVRKGGNSSDIGQSKSGGGTMWIPPCNPKIWDAEFDLNEDDVVRELRFQPCEYVKGDDGEFMVICGIPANCGSADYTMNRIEAWGSTSASYTINDPGLVKITKEEFVAECQRRKAEHKKEKNND